MSRSIDELALKVIEVRHEQFNSLHDGHYWPATHEQDVIILIKDAIAEYEADQGEAVDFDVVCESCGGTGSDRVDNNYVCVPCSGVGFVQKKLFLRPDPRVKELEQKVYEQACDKGLLRVQVAELERQLAEARKDAERYQLVRNQDRIRTGIPYIGTTTHVFDFEGKHLFGDAADKAIDEARSK